MLHSLIITLAVAAPLPTREAKPPTGPAPSFLQVSGVDREKGQLTVISVQFVPVSVPFVAEIEMMGKKVLVTKYKTEYRTETISIYLALKECKGQTADGKPLTVNDLVDRLTPGSTILMQNFGDKVDQAYLKILNSNTIILVKQTSEKVPGMDKIP